jgi:hypothetical protein
VLEVDIFDIMNVRRAKLRRGLIWKLKKII